MAIDISSIIQNHLTEETIEESISTETTETTETIAESSNGLGVDFSAVVENMDVSSDHSSDPEESFLSEGELQSIRGAIVSGIVAAHV